ncbi:recombination mediator RecR [Pseudomonadota bacterium]
MSEEIIEDLINLFSKIPSLGPRSARRAVLHLLKNKDNLMTPLLGVLQETIKNVKECENCGNFCTNKRCLICEDPTRQKATICVVESIADLWAIEKSEVYNGHYHVLGGTLSAIEGRGPENLKLDKLENKIKRDRIEEVIIATNSTLEGQTTAHYIFETLSNFDNLKVSKLTQGVPIGSELDYIDDGTLGIAFKTRRLF